MPHALEQKMVLPFPTWFEYVLIALTALGLIAFLAFLLFLLPRVWGKFFNWLGRNESRNLDNDHETKS